MNDENLRNAVSNANQALTLEKNQDKPSDRIQYMLAAFIDLATGLDELLSSIEIRLQHVEDSLRDPAKSASRKDR